MFRDDALSAIGGKAVGCNSALFPHRDATPALPTRWACVFLRVAYANAMGRLPRTECVPCVLRLPFPAYANAMGLLPRTECVPCVLMPCNLTQFFYNLLISIKQMINRESVFSGSFVAFSVVFRAVRIF